MKTSFKPEHLDQHVMRMQIRANHIYILFVALLNVLAYKCDLTSASKRSTGIDLGFRLLLLSAGVLSLVAFCTEHSGNLNLRTWTLFTVILSLAAIGLLLLNEGFQWVSKKKIGP